MRVDVDAFLGAYPFRRVPATSPAALLRAMDRVEVDEAWVSHLPSVFWRAPAEGNAWLYETAVRERRFRPVPAVHPGLAGWENALDDAIARGAPAVRCDPTHYGLDPGGAEMRVLAAACGAARLPLLMAVRLGDARLVVTHADRGFIEEVHFGSTPEEAARIWWDIAWVWGPPEDHLETLLTTVGVDRFVFGTGQPLRIP